VDPRLKHSGMTDEIGVSSDNYKLTTNN